MHHHEHHLLWCASRSGVEECQESMTSIHHRESLSIRLRPPNATLTLQIADKLNKAIEAAGRAFPLSVMVQVGSSLPEIYWQD